jgi:hypothetical protein
MIFKIFSPKTSANKMAFLPQNKSQVHIQKIDLNIVF